MNDIWDVAIVGCGPVGALAANLLAKAGLRTVILEREDAPFSLPRAVHLDHEMMRLFDNAGVLEAITPLMFAADGHIHIGADGGVIRYLGSAGKPQPFGFSNDYFFYQPELEAVLREALSGYPHAALKLGVSVDDLIRYEDGVTLTLASGEECRARYVIGCDGARSTVRKAIGIGLDDLGFEEPWLVVDAEVDGPISFPAFAGVPDEANLQRLSVMLCDPRRPATIVPGRGNHRRWEFMLLPGEDDRAMMAPDVVAALVEPWLAGVSHRIVRATTYRFHGLVAERWQVGRVFLAGDAAHQTPPFFGQGMCHGLRDVANLAWKLKLVLDGQSDIALLDTYQPERDPHVRAVIGAAVEAGRYICQLDPDLAAERDTRLRGVRGPVTAADLIPPIRDGVVDGAGPRFIQPIVERSDGTRSRLDAITGGGWVLIIDGTMVLSDDAAAVWDALDGSTVAIGRDVRDVEGHLTAWLKANEATAAIIRPDFYVFAAVSGATALSDAIVRLGEMLCLSTVPLAA